MEFDRQKMETNATCEIPLGVDHHESQTNVKPRGGWITFPFIAATMLGLGISFSGATSNLIVYLIKEFNVGNVDASQISNIVNGCTSLAPVAGAIISDAFFGCFPVVAVSTVINLLSLILFTLTATVRSLRPSPCTTDICEAPSATSFAILYLAVALLSVGTGGTRYTMMTMGANQFDKAKDHDTFVNWYLVSFYVSMMVGGTVIVYIQDSVSWGLGFGLCAVASAGSVIVFLAGSRFYRKSEEKGSPFAGLARVAVASVRKRKAERREGAEYYYGTGEEAKESTQEPTQGFRFLNRAALISEGDTNTDGSVAKPWKLCNVEQVEDLKTLLRAAPLWTSSMFLSISIGAQGSLTVLQALTMDRNIGHGFTVPAGSINVSAQLTSALCLLFLDRILMPTFRKVTRRPLTPLKKLGLGHVFNTSAMAISALVEHRRASVVREHNETGQADWTVPMSVVWLVMPLAMTGLGEALHFPGLVTFFYQEFPKSMSSTATGMVALLIANGFYMSTAVVSLVRRHTDWLPDNINASRLDKVYLMLTVIGVINFGYFLLCSILYRYKNGEEVVSNSSNDSDTG